MSIILADILFGAMRKAMAAEIGIASRHLGGIPPLSAGAEPG
jgi:hypothetical protein